MRIAFVSVYSPLPHYAVDPIFVPTFKDIRSFCLTCYRTRLNRGRAEINFTRILGIDPTYDRYKICFVLHGTLQTGVIWSQLRILKSRPEVYKTSALASELSCRLSSKKMGKINVGQISFPRRTERFLSTS